MAVMYIKEGPACSAALWHTGHTASVSRRGKGEAIVFGDVQIWFGLRTVCIERRSQQSGREKFSCGIGGMPAMWPMWDHVNVLSPAFWPPPFAATARGVRDLRVSVPYPPMADPGTIPHPRRARPGAPGRRGAGERGRRPARRAPSLHAPPAAPPRVAGSVRGNDRRRKV